MGATKLVAVGLMAAGTPAVSTVAVVVIDATEYLFVGSPTGNRLSFVATNLIITEDEVGYRSDSCDDTDSLGDHPVNVPETNDPRIDDLRIITPDRGVLVFNFDTGDCYDGDDGPIILLDSRNYTFALEYPEDGQPTLFLNPVRIGTER